MAETSKTGEEWAALGIAPMQTQLVATPDLYAAIRCEVVEEIIADLRFLAEARKDYCARCPETQNEMRDMTPTELGVHDGHATAAWLADILEGTNTGHGWLPSWRWDEWVERQRP